MGGRILIGTSGWSYKHWRGLYYPQKLRPTEWLKYYAAFFATTEINGSFYKLPSIETIERWKSEVPANFIFCPKMSRYLSHMKKLNDPEEPLERFFSLFHVLDKQMGPVLIQLPHFLPFHVERVEYFYELLRKQYSRYSFVMEVRHESWLHKDSLTLMMRYHIGFVISHSFNEFPYAEIITSKDIYVRFHGPGELYASSYASRFLTNYARKINSWSGEGYNVWVYFNNDIYGYAIENAKLLEQKIKNKEQ